MTQVSGDQTVEQVADWYLRWATEGKHSPTGQPKTKSAIIVQRSLLQNHISQGVRAKAFSQLSAQDMQTVIDDVAAAGDEPAALGIKTFFVELEKFAVRNSALPKIRSRDLTGPIQLRKPRRLSDKEFAEAWDGYRRFAFSGDVVERVPCLAILFSAATLQTPQRVVGMGRDQIDLEAKLWTFQAAGEASCRYVYLSDLALELAQSAFDLGDFIHRTTATPFLFPSAGPKRDPFRSVGFTMLSRVTHQISSRADIKPDDLRHTGIEALKGMGGPEFHAIVDAIADGSTQKPSSDQAAIVAAWTDRICQLTANQPD